MNQPANNAVNISGGAVTAGVILAGSNNKLIQKLSASGGNFNEAEFRMKVNELIGLLENNSHSIKEAAEMKEAIVSELRKESPSPFTLKAILAGIANAAGHVAQIAGTASAIKSALEKLC